MHVLQLGQSNITIIFWIEAWTELRSTKVFARKVIRIPSGRGTHREKLARLMRNELDLLMRARHPHVLRYVHHDSMPDTLQIFTEFCEGGDLYRRMEDSERYGTIIRIHLTLCLLCVS